MCCGITSNLIVVDPNVKRRDFEEYMNVMNDTNAGNRGLARMNKNVGFQQRSLA